MIAANALGRVSRVPAPAMQVRGAPPSPVDAMTPPRVEIQGETLRTWAFKSPAVEKVQVDLSTLGRPLEATVEVWNAAGNTPFQARVYSEDGEVRPINVVLETPRGPSTVAVRNIGQMEFPMNAEVDEMYVPEPSLEHQNVAQYIQGGALKTFPMDPAVEAVVVLLTSDGMPMNARIEILQGPDTNKQVIELYSENGLDRPFLRHVCDALLRQRCARPEHRPHGVPPDRLGCTGAGLKASGGWLAVRLTSGARLGRREVPLQEWYPVHFVLLPSLR